MVPRPSSPTSLLWAHQLKREHTHLVERVKGLEATRDTYDARLKAAEGSNQAVSHSIADTAQLKARIAAIEEDDKDARNRIEQRDAERRVWTSEVDGKLQALERRLTPLEVGGDRMDEERTKHASRHEAILNRLEAIETAQEKHSRAAEKLGRKDDPSDARVVHRRLELLETRSNENGAVTKAVSDRIATLEKANYELHELVLQYRQLLEGVKAMESHLTARLQQAPKIPGDTPDGIEALQSSSPVVQVPRSPLVEKQARNRTKNAEARVANGAVQDMSRLRRSARIAAPVNSDGLAMHLLQQAEGSQLSSAPVVSTEASGLANSRRKRKAIPVEDAERKRAAAKRMKPPAEVVVPCERKKADPARNRESGKPAPTKQSTAGPAQRGAEPSHCRPETARPAASKPQRKRREIPQPYALAPPEMHLSF